MAKKKTKKKELKISDAFDELEEIVTEFEEGDVQLEDSIEKFKRGIELSRYLKKRLKEVENEIIEIKEEVDQTTTNKDSGANKKDDSQEEIPF